MVAYSLSRKGPVWGAGLGCPSGLPKWPAQVARARAAACLPSP
ncbi:hypothetical protein FBZ94_10999 [Bradyrhizobium sacchari]|uniref:Uncharacterized protein n=1 Tax=Bradyrhizobium sacchari TaxID=1399419 RepID=A0A560I0D1_9BRAD|nr:hypothetical protein FBZ94_10999 [Bradyrhizobium sacchari]TWB70262.1 hypothetical protein FBZ95_108264 [Bradyrhizobium sacchari]